MGTSTFITGAAGGIININELPVRAKVDSLRSDVSILQDFVSGDNVEDIPDGSKALTAYGQALMSVLSMLGALSELLVRDIANYDTAIDAIDAIVETDSTLASKLLSGTARTASLK